MNIFELAGEAYDQFETAERADGESFVRLKEGAPDWLVTLVHEAHGDFLPDDWRYACIKSALGFIHDNEPGELDDSHELLDDSHEFADGEVDVYTSARLAWLSSNLNRASYCDEAVEEFGISDDGGIIDRIGLGQYAEASEVYYSVVTSLRVRLDDLGLDSED